MSNKCSSLTLCEGVDSSISFAEVDQVAMVWGNSNPKGHGFLSAVFVFCFEGLTGDHEPQVASLKNPQCWGTFVNYNLRYSIIHWQDSYPHHLRLSSLKHRVREDVEVCVSAIGDSEGEAVLCTLCAIMLVADHVLIQVLLCEGGDGSSVVKKQETMNWNLSDCELQAAVHSVSVLHC